MMSTSTVNPVESQDDLKCLPTARNKRDRSLRVNIDRPLSLIIIVGLIIYSPMMWKSANNAGRCLAGPQKRRTALAISPAFSASIFRLFRNHAFRDTERWLVRTRCILIHHGTARIADQEEFNQQKGLFQLFERATDTALICLRTF